MSSRSIRLSEKHGLNPSILHCPICGKETGVGLFGKLKGDAEAPRDMVDNNPCKNCQKVIDDGGHFIIETEQFKWASSWELGLLNYLFPKCGVRNTITH